MSACVWIWACELNCIFKAPAQRGSLHLLDDLAQLQFFWINLILLLYYLTIIENFSILGYLCPSSQWGNSIDTCVKLGDHLNLFNCHHKYSNQHQLRLRSRFQIHRNLFMEQKYKLCGTSIFFVSIKMQNLCRMYSYHCKMSMLRICTHTKRGHAQCQGWGHRLCAVYRRQRMGKI